MEAEPFGSTLLRFNVRADGSVGYHFALNSEGRRPPLVALAAVMSLAAFNAARNIPLAAIALALPVARHVSLVVGRLRERRSAQGVRFETEPERSTRQPMDGRAVAIVLGFVRAFFSATACARGLSQRRGHLSCSDTGLPEMC